MNPRAAVVARLVAVVVMLALAAGVRADWTLVDERHFAVSLGGRPCGRSVERVERDGELVRTTSELEMRFLRAGQRTDVGLSSQFVETARGRPASATVWQNGRVAGRFAFAEPAAGRFEVTIQQGEPGAEGAKELRQSMPDDGWLAPFAAASFVAARVKAEAKEISLRAISIQSGLVVQSLGMKLEERGEFELADGRRIAALRYAVTNSLVPVPGSERYDLEGRLLESSTTIAGLGELTMRLSTPAIAAASLAKGDFDLLSGTFVPCPPIAFYARRERLSVEVVSSDGSLDELPSVGAQRFERIDAARGVVSVTVGRGSAAEPGDAKDPRWTRETDAIDHAHPAVRELLATRPRREGESERERVESLRRLVARHLARKDLATAFGSASEAARERSGDCTEHAVLLAALLRADRIPSRVVSGLVYVPSMAGSGPGWGWHLWTQALVPAEGAARDGSADAAGGFEWLDLDATLAVDGPGFHPAHIAVAPSDLAGGAADPAFLKALGMLGGLRISTVKEAP